MIFHDIFLVKSLTFIPFHSIAMYFLHFIISYRDVQNFTVCYCTISPLDNICKYFAIVKRKVIFPILQILSWMSFTLNFVIRVCVVIWNVVAPSSTFRHKQAECSSLVIILNSSASFGRKPSDRQTFVRRSLWQALLWSPHLADSRSVCVSTKCLSAKWFSTIWRGTF
jgi:hypothetical protein